MSERTLFGSSARCLRALVFAVLFSAIAGCGQSGPLTLPGKHAKNTAAAQQQDQKKQDGENKKKNDESDTSEDGR